MSVSRDELIEVQMREYPDSRIMTLSEVYKEWMDGVGNIESYEKSFALDEECFDSVIAFRMAQNAHIEKEILRHQLQIASSLAICLQFERVVFYECGLREGKYRWRGARFGVNGSEYLSGFGLF